MKRCSLTLTLLMLVLCVLASSCQKRTFIDGIVWHFDSMPRQIDNRVVSRADKEWKKAARDHNNAFFYRDWTDSVYVWFYSRENGRNFLTMEFISPEAKVYSLTMHYSRSLEWLSDESYESSQDCNLNVYTGATPDVREFVYLSRAEYCTDMIPALKPEYVDTITNPFLHNYMRDFNDYIEPFIRSSICVNDRPR